MTEMIRENPKENPDRESFQDKGLSPQLRDISDQLVHLSNGLHVVQIFLSESEMHRKRSMHHQSSPSQAILILVIVICCLFSLVLGYGLGFNSGISLRPPAEPVGSISYLVDL